MIKNMNVSKTVHWLLSYSSSTPDSNTVKACNVDTETNGTRANNDDMQLYKEKKFCEIVLILSKKIQVMNLGKR